MDFCFSMLFICFISALIFEPSIAFESFQKSYSLICDVLLPSVFPFLIVTQMAVLTNIKDFISLPFLWIFRLLKLPYKLAPLFLCSVLGGYPTGVKALSAGCDSKALTKEEACEFLPFLINAGPGFVVMAVGKMMFGSLKLGIILYISQIASSLIIGRILFKDRNIKPGVITNALTYSDALIVSVNGACDSMMGICGFVLFFSLVNSFAVRLMGEGISVKLIASFTEVTNGCKIASGIKGGYLLSSFLISFSGLSCIYQVKSIASKSGINAGHIFTIKLLEGAAAAFITCLLVKLYPITVNTTALQSPPLHFYSGNRILETFLLGALFCRLFAGSDFTKK